MDNQAVINFQKKYLQIVCFTMALCSLFLTKIVSAEQYQLQLLVDLSALNDVGTDAVWLDPLTNPANGDEFFVAQDNGVIYLAGNNVTDQKSILNLAQSLNDRAFIALTSIVLHPSFTKPEQPGYATFFTAHSSEFSQDIKNNRIVPNGTDDDSNIDFAFETVITAWQYDFDTQQIDPQSQREVLRIPIKAQDNAIQNLAFDPYQKLWSADYGQLYFSLNYINDLQQYPLYSGAILRVHPQVFGARNYTVPSTNPFIKDPKVNNAIVVMNGKNIQNFFWAKSEHAAIFVQHGSSEQFSLSKAKLGDDLLSKYQVGILWQQPNNMATMLLYQGRDVLSLRNNLVFFTLIDNQWHLTSRSLEPVNNEASIFQAPIDTQALSANANLNIHQNDQGEMLLLDHSESRIYSLQLANSAVVASRAPQSNSPAPESNSYVLYLSLLALSVILLIFVYRKNAAQGPTIGLLEKDHVRFKYEQTTQRILLFIGNQDNVYKTLALSDITRCEIVLNHNVISLIDEQPENALSNQTEADIRALFTEEHGDKMTEEKTRRIEIVLSDKDDSYPVSVYLRKGKARVIGTKYYEVIDILLDLCWNISKKINPNATEARVIQKVAFSRHYEAAPTREPNVVPAIKYSNVNHSPDDPVSPSISAANTESHKSQQTEVVAALDKLVNLHQKGYLSDEEFSLAKTKVLQKLIDN